MITELGFELGTIVDIRSVDDKRWKRVVLGREWSIFCFSTAPLRRYELSLNVRGHRTHYFTYVKSTENMMQRIFSECFGRGKEVSTE